MKATSCGTGHGVEFDAAAQEKFDLFLGRAVLDQIRPNRIVAAAIVDALGQEPVDIAEPQPEVDDFDGVLERIAPGVPLQRAGDRKAGLVEVVQHQQRDLMLAAQLVDQLPRRGDATPFVDMMAMSKRSASFTASKSGMKPSFSMNRMAPKRSRRAAGREGGRAESKSTSSSGS